MIIRVSVRSMMSNILIDAWEFPVKFTKAGNFTADTTDILKCALSRIEDRDDFIITISQPTVQNTI